MLNYIYNPAVLVTLFLCFTNALYPINHRAGETVADHATVSQTPIVIWHGMGDSCCNPMSMGYVKKLLKTHIPGVYVNSLMLGSNVIEDTEHGFFANMNELVDNACEQIQKDTNLQNGYHAMGFSQGGLFIRALAQRCPHPPMKNLISVGGPQQGIYGLPYCTSLHQSGLCDAVRHLLNYGAYTSLEGYANYSIFLADLNCAQNTCNPAYKQNIAKLQNLVLVKFLRDEKVVPKESEWFGYYPDNNSSVIVDMENTPLYKEDWIGMKTLKDSNRLHLLAVDGRHLQIPADILKQKTNDEKMIAKIYP
uniref:Palmitoyl-protein thioesterase 1 n=1 Tax=Ditylenchus dipsaci TaxID=166011 RepID=A0A915CYA9_9BILA